MALNLSTLTSSATSGDVLQEVLTTADFLEPCPVLRNLSRGSNKGGDAKQDVALNQPRSLPLIKNPAGNLGGYLYIPNASGNYAEGPSVTIGSNETWEGELDMVVTQWGAHMTPMGGGFWSNGFGLVFYTSGAVRLFSKGSGASTVGSGVTLGTTFNVKYGFNGSAIYVDIDGTRVYSDNSAGIVSLQSGSITHTLELNQQANIGNVGNYAIQKAKLTVNSAVVFDCDFNGSTSIRHGDTKFNCVGGPVSLTRASNDPITVVKKDILRFDGVNDRLLGSLGTTLTDGYYFAAFSVLGGGGEQFSVIAGLNQTGGNTISTTGYGFSTRDSDNLASFNSLTPLTHTDLYDDVNGDILHEAKFTPTAQSTKVNNADEISVNFTIATSAQEFSIAERIGSGLNAAIDLEFLALFSADSVPDEATASKIRDYINKRNQIYLRHQTDGFFFFDPQKLAAGDVTSWNGNITGSDLGDTDVATNVTIVQGSQTSQPNADGYSLTFEDNTQHLEWASAYTPNFPAGQTKAWQIVGTSLGTFAYLTQGAVTELNLLGNFGHASFRKVGILYGIILLPESATGADIEAARKLLIDRGAADGAYVGSLGKAWHSRTDISEFNQTDFSNTTSSSYAWFQNTNLNSFKPTNFDSCTVFIESWKNCTSLNDFAPIQAPLGSNFSSAWQGTSALTSFPAGAKLGTSAQSVNFTDAWRQSGLTSFSTPLPTATTLSSSFRYCYSLNSFNLDEIPLAAHINTAFQGNAITSFNTKLPKVKYAYAAWYGCTALTDFSADVFTNWNPSSILTRVFHDTWSLCASLTAQSVGNILQSIDASNQHGTDDGTSTGNPLGDSGIDIDYDGTTLSAATNTAIDSLKTKGWSIFINSVEQ